MMASQCLAWSGGFWVAKCAGRRPAWLAGPGRAALGVERKCDECRERDTRLDHGTQANRHERLGERDNGLSSGERRGNGNREPGNREQGAGRWSLVLVAGRGRHSERVVIPSGGRSGCRSGRMRNRDHTGRGPLYRDDHDSSTPRLRPPLGMTKASPAFRTRLAGVRSHVPPRPAPVVFA